MSPQDYITASIKNEIIKPTIDISTDYSEVALDSLLDEGLLKDIPIIKTIVGFYNITQSINSRYNIKKILTFFQYLHRGTIDATKHEQFLTKFNNDKEYQRKIVETIVILNERFLEIEKSKIYANLIRSHIEGNLSWSELQNISTILNNINMAGLPFLEKMARNNWSYHS